MASGCIMALQCNSDSVHLGCNDESALPKSVGSV
ncbi:hypothetical protein AAHB65_26705 [Bacillus toyonensis]